MAKPKTIKPQDAARRAAKAHTNLNTFASVVTLLEGGHISGGKHHEAVSKIVKLCHAEQARALYDYDLAMEEIANAQ